MAGSNGRVPGVEARAGKFPGPSLIPPLTAIQREHGWLPREELVKLSRDWRRPLYEIEGLVSFYPHFRTGPPEPFEVAVCRDLSCWLARDRAEVPEGATVHEVSCVGRCDQAPVAIVEEQYPDARTGARRRPNDPYTSTDEHYRVFRTVSGRFEVSINGRRYPNVGRICMDQFVVDLGPGGTDVAVGDDAILFGPGTAGEPTAQDWAELLGTINYEVVTSPRGRIGRSYVGGGSR